MSTEQTPNRTEKSYDPARKLNGASKERTGENHAMASDDSSSEKTLDRAKEQAQNLAEAGRAYAGDFNDNLQNSVRQNPLLALGAAFSFGVAVAMIIARKD